MIVCICHGINDKTIRASVARGAVSLDEIQIATGASTCCGACRDCVLEIVGDELSFGATAVSGVPSAASHVQ
jgi:bacterioferritin-associated ferredoxin